MLQELHLKAFSHASSDIRAVRGLTGVVALALLVLLPGGGASGQPLRPGVQAAIGSAESGRAHVITPDIPVDDLN